MASSLSAWDLAEGFHLAHAADFVVARDLLDETETPVEALSEAAGVDPRLLGPMLEFLAARTDLVVRGPGGFRAGPGLDPLDAAVIAQYVGAYGPNAAALADVLTRPERGRGLVDRVRHAAAFAHAPGAGATILPGILRDLGLQGVLDLGCGTGDLLVELASGDPSFRGFGIDSNPAMVAVARGRARARGISAEQLQFLVGDIAALATTIGPAVAAEVTIATAASVVNEFSDDVAVAAWLRSLAEVLPGRLLIVLDYYGVLGRVADPPPKRVLHDWVQLISSQALPPANLEGWKSWYDAADCQLVDFVEDPPSGVFLHVVQLPATRTSARSAGLLR